MFHIQRFTFTCFMLLWLLIFLFRFFRAVPSLEVSNVRGQGNRDFFFFVEGRRTIHSTENEEVQIKNSSLLILILHRQRIIFHWVLQLTALTPKWPPTPAPNPKIRDLRSGGWPFWEFFEFKNFVNLVASARTVTFFPLDLPHCRGRPALEPKASEGPRKW